MITFELAQKLHKAGLRRVGNIELTQFFISENTIMIWQDIMKARNTIGGLPYWKEFVPVYTLEELIDACGNNFGEFKKANNTWWANNGKEKNDGTNEMEVYGETPEEAIAKLWLALNNK